MTTAYTTHPTRSEAIRLAGRAAEIAGKPTMIWAVDDQQTAWAVAPYTGDSSNPTWRVVMPDGVVLKLS